MMIVPATSGTQSMVELSPVQHAELIPRLRRDEDPGGRAAGGHGGGDLRHGAELHPRRPGTSWWWCATSPPPSPTPTPSSRSSPRITACSASRWWQHGPLLREGQELFAKLTRVTDRFLDTSLELVACVPYDTNLRAAVLKRS